MSNACKNFVSINGAIIVKWATSIWCSLGLPPVHLATITRGVQQEKILQYLSPWLMLSWSCQAGIDFQNLRDNDTTITFLQSCDLCTSTAIDQLSIDRLTAVPNPFDNSITVDLGETLPECKVTIFDMSGRLLRQQFFYGQKSVLIDNLSLCAGTYLVQLLNVVKGEKKQVLAVKN